MLACHSDTVSLHVLLQSWCPLPALTGTTGPPPAPAPPARSATNIFIRVQARVVAPVQLAILLSILLLELVPTLRSSCMSEVSSQLGDLPVMLSLAVASTIFCVL